VAPLLDRALADGRRDTWPRLVLHLDFKTNEPEHHEAVWKLLGRYERWLTTAVKAADDAPAPLAWGPLLVLTEAGDGQEQVFQRDVPIGQPLRLFGTVPSAQRDLPEAQEARAAALVAAPAAVLIPSGASNYRRWTNFPWAVVEHGGQARAADWTAEDDRRLRAIVGRAHAQGLWVRFYTLNGHAAAEDEGWSAGYNFGGLDEAEHRWRAAIAAGVDLVATDQYEAFARVLTATPP
jgi:glycerophosphoryl diester phosphodiesterase